MPSRLVSDFNSEWDADSYVDTFYMCRDGFAEHMYRGMFQFIDAALKGHRYQRAMNFGCGPVPIHFIAMAPWVERMDGADVARNNLDDIQRWQRDDAGARDWSGYTRMMLDSLQLSASDEDVQTREWLARSKLVDMLHGDFLQAAPCGVERAGSYDLLTSFFCADSACSSFEAWADAVGNILSLLGASGRVIFSSLCSGEDACYRNGDAVFPIAPGVGEAAWAAVLSDHGFDPSSMVFSSIDDLDPDGSPQRFQFVTAVRSA